jgi:hypothetical protein
MATLVFTLNHSNMNVVCFRQTVCNITPIGPSEVRAPAVGVAHAGGLVF